MVLDGLVGTATVTTQGPHRRLRHDAKGGDFYLATSGDLDMATSGDFFMATDTRSGRVARGYSRLINSRACQLRDGSRPLGSKPLLLRKANPSSDAGPLNADERPARSGPHLEAPATVCEPGHAAV